MGLLDILNTDDGRFGLGLLAAAAPRTDGAGFGQRLNEAVGSVDQFKRQKLLAKLQELQMQEAESSLADKQAQRAQQQQMQELYKRFAVPGQAGVPAIQGDAESGILPSAGQPAKPGGYDYKGLANTIASIDPMKALQLQQSLQKDSQVNKLDVKDFDPSSVAKFMQSGNYGDLVRMDKAHVANIGGKTVAMNPFTGQPLNSIENTQSPDNAASVGATLRGQNMTDARARDMQRFTAEQAGKPQFHDGQWVMPPSAGNPQGVATPVAGYQKPLDVSQKKQLSGIESLNGAIGEYVNNLQSWNKLGALSPDARAEMGTKYNNMMLQAKEAYNLGVLNGPDFQILQSVVTDPRSLTGAFTSKKALEKQATELGRIMSTVTAPAVRGGGVGAEAGVKPVAGKAPMKGQTVDGYKFKGGNPADPNSWERQ